MSLIADQSTTSCAQASATFSPQQEDIEVVGEASDGRGAVTVQLAERQLALRMWSIMDIAMPNLNGLAEGGVKILRREL